MTSAVVVARVWHAERGSPVGGMRGDYRETPLELGRNHGSGRRESNPHDQLGRSVTLNEHEQDRRTRW